MKIIPRIALLLIFQVLLMDAQTKNEVDRTTRPKGKPTAAAKLPVIQKTTLNNGLAVWLVEHHELPTVALNLVIQSGSDHDPLNLPGLAAMTADLLDEGTATRDALQIADELEAIGASLGVGSSFDGSFVTLGLLKKYLPRGLEVFADVISHPTFPQKDLDRLRKQRLTGLLQQRDMPETIANNVFSFILYGPEHPYGNNPSGTETSLNAISRDQVRSFYESYYRPNNATLLIVGDVRLSDVVPVLERSLADWKKADIPAFTLPKAPSPQKRRVYLVDKPDAPQSQVRIGYPALSRNTPDFFAVTLMNRMLGGQFTSRINLNLRERRGYTYGARSSFSFQKGEGPFSASGGIVTDKTDSAVTEFLNEITLMKEKGMTEEELAFVKRGVAGNFALTFETPGQIAGMLQNVVLYNLPQDYFDHYLQNVNAVTLDDVNRAAAKYLDPATMAVVVVGDLAKIEKGMRASNFGEVTLLDVTGRPLP